MNIKLRIMADERIDKVAVPIQSATVVNPGDLVCYEGGYATLLDAAADDATFIGVAETQSKAGEVEDLIVIKKGIFESTLASAAYTIGQALAYNASGYLEASTANTIAWMHESSKGATVASGKILIDVVQLAKLFAINA